MCSELFASNDWDAVILRCQFDDLDYSLYGKMLIFITVVSLLFFHHDIHRLQVSKLAFCNQ